MYNNNNHAKYIKEIINLTCDCQKKKYPEIHSPFEFFKFSYIFSSKHRKFKSHTATTGLLPLTFSPRLSLEQ